MSETPTEKGFKRLQEPDKKKAKIQNPMGLIFKLVWAAIVTLPLIIISIIKYYTKKPKSLNGKIALVTGSGRGLGRGLALELADKGCKIACVDIDEENNKETVSLINEKYPDHAKSYKGNIASVEEVHKLRKNVEGDFGEVDLLVNNAGIVMGQSILAESNELINTILSVNLASHFWMIREFLPDMLKRNSGHIVAISSASGLSGVAKAPTYSATKWGIIGLMESVYAEINYKPGNNVKFTTVCPYFINTSKDYTDNWKLTIPVLTIQRTASDIVDGIRKDVKIFTVPSDMYWSLHILKLLPDDLVKMVKNIFEVKVKKVNMSNYENNITKKLLER